MTNPPREFANYAVVDWSGAKTERPGGLAVALARSGASPPAMLTPATAWSRAGLLDWFRGLAAEQADIVIGLDLSPALPFADEEAYFPGWDRSPPDARSLWALVEELSADDPHFAATSFVGHPVVSRYLRVQKETGDRFGERGGGRLRVCEQAQQAMGLSPSSCLNLVGAAQVGKSSFTGMRVLHALDGSIPVWPFDPVPANGPLVVEIYTSLAAREAGVRKGLSKTLDPDRLDELLAVFGSEPHVRLSRYDDHITDALLTAAWLRDIAREPERWHPAAFTPAIARTEGWTFGVV